MPFDLRTAVSSYQNPALKVPLLHCLCVSLCCLWKQAMWLQRKFQLLCCARGLSVPGGAAVRLKHKLLIGALKAKKSLPSLDSAKCSYLLERGDVNSYPSSTTNVLCEKNMVQIGSTLKPSELLSPGPGFHGNPHCLK